MMDDGMVITRSAEGLANSAALRQQMMAPHGSQRCKYFKHQAARSLRVLYPPHEALSSMKVRKKPPLFRSAAGRSRNTSISATAYDRTPSSEFRMIEGGMWEGEETYTLLDQLHISKADPDPPRPT